MRHSFLIKTLTLGCLVAGLVAPGINADDNQSKNPVIAIVGGKKKIYYMDLLARKNAFKELQAVPVEAVYEGLLQQMVAEQLIEDVVKQQNMDNDPEVMERAKKCKEAAKMQTYIERQIEKMVTDEELMTLFKDLMKDYKKQKEVRAQHILVANEQEAHGIIKDLEAGKDFADIARTKSVDPTTKERGGDLGYFVKDIAKETMGPDFAESVFILKPGSFTRKPVKTRFGFHVLKVNDSRTSKPPKFEEVAPQLRQIKSQEALLKFIDGLKKQHNVQLFDVQGKPLQEKVKVK